MSEDASRLAIVGGPNGCGKTTFARAYAEQEGLTYLGADDVAARLSPAIRRRRGWRRGGSSGGSWHNRWKRGRRWWWSPRFPAAASRGMSSGRGGRDKG